MKRLLFLTLIATAVLALPICPTQSITHNDMALTTTSTIDASAPALATMATNTVNAVISTIAPASANAGILAPTACWLYEEFGGKPLLWLCQVMCELEGYDPGE